MKADDVDKIFSVFVEIEIRLNIMSTEFLFRQSHIRCKLIPLIRCDCVKTMKMTREFDELFLCLRR